LKRWRRTATARQKHFWEAKIILLTADGCGIAEIMQPIGKAKPVIGRWQDRFRGPWRGGALAGLRRGRRASPEVAMTLAGPPPAASHWTGSAMAKAVGISVSSVQRIVACSALQSPLVRRF